MCFYIEIQLPEHDRIIYGKKAANLIKCNILLQINIKQILLESGPEMNIYN